MECTLRLDSMDYISRGLLVCLENEEEFADKEIFIRDLQQGYVLAMNGPRTVPALPRRAYLASPTTSGRETRLR